MCNGGLPGTDQQNRHIHETCDVCFPLNTDQYINIVNFKKPTYYHGEGVEGILPM